MESVNQNFKSCAVFACISILILSCLDRAVDSNHTAFFEETGNIFCICSPCNTVDKVCFSFAVCKSVNCDGKAAYADTVIAGSSQIASDLSDLTALVIAGEMTVEDMMAELKEAADEYIADALEK